MSDSEISRLLGEMKALGARLPGIPSPYPLEAPTFGPPASWADITVLEEKAASSLPADYKEFLQECGPVSAMYFHTGYDFLARPVIERIMSQYVEVPGAVLREDGRVSIVPIAGDGSGNLYLIATRPPFTVWKWDHETGTAQDGVLSEGSTALLPVAENFTGFLRRVIEDWRHFLDEDTDWNYLSG